MSSHLSAGHPSFGRGYVGPGCPRPRRERVGSSRRSRTGRHGRDREWAKNAPAPTSTTASPAGATNFISTVSTPAAPSAWRSPRLSAKRSVRPQTGSPPSTVMDNCATAPRSARSPAWSVPAATRAAPGSSCAANARIPARNYPCSTPSRACAIRSWPPTPHPATGRSNTSKPATAPTPASEDRIRTGKDTGFGRFPSCVFAINQAWLELALTGIDLLAWTQHLLLDGELAAAEPKKLRYRLLHVAARLTRSARRTRLRIAETRPWATNLAAAFGRLAALPRPNS
jgi:hypothetical protein